MQSALFSLYPPSVGGRMGKLVMSRTVGAGLFLVFLTLFAFWGVRHAGFLNFDDDKNVTKNPVVLHGLTARGLYTAFTDVRTLRLWMPLTLVSHMTAVEVFGLDPRGHHALNLALHMANVVLLFLVLRRMTRDYWPSLFVAAVFAVHPLNVEPVAWITSRKDVLSAFFLLLMLLAYAWHAENPSWPRLAVVLACFFMGLASKPAVVAAPFALLLLDYWPLKRWDGETKGFRAIVRKFGALAWEKTGLFLLSIFGCVVALFGENRLGTGEAYEQYPLEIRLANASLSYWAYVGKVVWPSGLSPTYPYSAEAVSLWLGSLAGLMLVCVSLLMLWGRKRWPYLPVGWFWYTGMLLPVIGIVQQGNYAMADRHCYVPAIGLFVLGTWWVRDLLLRWRWGRLGLGLTGASVVAILTVCTVWQVGYWRDSETLFRHALQVTENNALAYNNLGNAVLAQGRTREAARCFAKAVQIRPTLRIAWNNLGVALFDMGEYEKAANICAQIVARAPDEAIAHFNLGMALARLGRPADAAAQFKEALRCDPGFARARDELRSLPMAKEEAPPATDGASVP